MRGLGSSAKLTPQEWQVLAYLKQGMSNMEIAHAMCIGLCTVKTHVHHIMQKTEKKNRTQLALLPLSGDGCAEVDKNQSLD